MTTIVVPSSSRMPSSSSPSASLSACAMPAEGSSSSSSRGCSVSRQAISTTRRVPVESSAIVWCGERREAHPLHQLVGRGGLRPVRDRFAPTAALHSQVGSSRSARDHQRLAHRQRREQRGVLERTDQAGAGALLRRRRR